MSKHSFGCTAAILCQRHFLVLCCHRCAQSSRDSQFCCSVGRGRCCSKLRLLLPTAWALMMINAPAKETSPAVINRKLCARFSWSADGAFSVALCALVLPPPRLLLVPAALEPTGWAILLAIHPQNGARRLPAWSAGSSILDLSSPHLAGTAWLFVWLIQPTRRL
jgi:hypothetical protein